VGATGPLLGVFIRPVQINILENMWCLKVW